MVLADSPPSLAPARAAAPRLGAWYAYVTAWLAAWLAIVVTGGHWPGVLGHWPMALVMACGSFVAGSTPMGGGSVSFPALVLLLGRTPHMARDFGLAIQSAGMTSALVFIWCRRTALDRGMLGWAFTGSLVGLAAGTLLVAPVVPADAVKLLFATVWIVFAAWLIARDSGDEAHANRPVRSPALGLAAGVVGGVMAAIVGVGVEMAVFATLVLARGWDPKAAVPTAVGAMALASPVGLAWRVATAGIDPAVLLDWLAAVPIVLLGAPAGAYAATHVRRRVMLAAIGALTVVQFAWTIVQVRPGAAGWAGMAVVAAAVALALGGLANRRADA